MTDERSEAGPASTEGEASFPRDRVLHVVCPVSRVAITELAGPEAVVGATFECAHCHQRRPLMEFSWLDGESVA